MECIGPDYAQFCQLREHFRQSLCASLLDATAQQQDQHPDILTAREQTARITLNFRPVHGFRRTDKITILRLRLGGGRG